MSDDLIKLVNDQKSVLTQFSIEQDRIFNRYVVLGSGVSVTLLINLLSKNPKFFEHSEYMVWAFWSFSSSIILGAFCLFLNARLSDYSQLQHTKLYGFLAGIRVGDENFDYSDFNHKLIREKVLETNSRGYRWSRRLVMGIELFSGLCFCIGIGISMYEIGKLL